MCFYMKLTIAVNLLVFDCHPPPALAQQVQNHAPSRPLPHQAHSSLDSEKQLNYTGISQHLSTLAVLMSLTCIKHD